MQRVGHDRFHHRSPSPPTTADTSFLPSIHLRRFCPFASLEALLIPTGETVKCHVSMSLKPSPVLVGGHARIDHSKQCASMPKMMGFEGVKLGRNPPGARNSAEVMHACIFWVKCSMRSHCGMSSKRATCSRARTQAKCDVHVLGVEFKQMR